MSQPRISVEGDLSELKSHLCKSDKYSQYIRILVVYKIKQGHKAEDLAVLYNVSHKSICNWVHRYNTEGIEGLKDKPRSGRPSRLTAEQFSKLSEVLSCSPEDFGYNSGVWSGPLVNDYIQKVFGVTYKRAQVYNLLRDIGFSYQRGKAFYPEVADRAEKVAVIKKNSKL
jgi:transposase